MAKNASNRKSTNIPAKSKKKPEAPSWLLENIAEASKNARTIYFLFVGFLVYCGLTVVGIKDRQIILNDAVSLPILRMDVPLNGFFILAPVIVIFLFLYFQLYLIIRKRLITNLKANYAQIGEERLYPWMLLALDYPKKGFIWWIQSAIVKFSVWCSVPLVLLLISTWFVKKHAPILSYVIGLTPIIGTIIVLYFWFQYENATFKIHQILKHIKNNLGKSILIFLVIIYEVFFLSYIIPSANDAFPQVSFSNELLEKGVLYKLKSFFCVDLSYQKLVTEPENDYPGIYWLDLSGAHLEGANLESTVLKRADLRGAQLQNAIMWSAILHDADLYKANLQGARLWNANLQGAKLNDANLKGADLGGANLQEADLWTASFQGADLCYAKLQKANFQDTNLQDANLEGADLRGANLKRAELSNANLQGAKLAFAKLQETTFTKTDLRGANLWEANLQEADLRYTDLQRAGLLNANLQGAKLRDANLQGAGLWDANLQRADLFMADLQDANLQRADLRGAENLAVEQLSKVETLYQAKLDLPLLKEIKEKYPHLLEEPAWLKEEEEEE